MWVLVCLLDIVPRLDGADEWTVVRRGCSDLCFTLFPVLGMRLR